MQSLASLQPLRVSTIIAVWVPHIGQHLCVQIEHGKPEDRFAIAVRKHDDRSWRTGLNGGVFTANVNIDCCVFLGVVKTRSIFRSIHTEH